MGLREADRCGYCGRPLRLVAGFCAECLAPAPVARQAKLVADARRRAGLHVTAQSSVARIIAPTVEASVAALAQKPLPRWPATLAIVGVMALLIASGTIAFRVAAVTPKGFAPLADATLSVLLGHAGGTAIDSVSVGTAIVVEYGVVPGRDPVDVTLTISPLGNTPFVLAERWPPNAPLRDLLIVPNLPGQWRITLARDQQILRSVDLHIISNG